MESAKATLISSLPNERIISIDVLRGMAVLGILIMNIQSFSMIGAAYINPTAYGDLTGLNKWVWIFSHVFASEKFMSIFSILFGAGVLLFTDRALAKGRKASAFHYRRMLWLLAFGFIHAYLIWYGDILVNYSLCGMLVYLFRKMKPTTLLIYSILFFVIPIIFAVFAGVSIPYWPAESYEQNMQNWLPGAEKVSHEISAMQGSWHDQMEVRVPGAIFLQTFLFFWMSFWRVTSMMLLGMALYKWGVLTAQRPGNFYAKLAMIGLISGYGISALGVFQNYQHDWKMEFSMFYGAQFNYIGSAFTSLGYISILMLISQSEAYKNFKKLFSSVGKMAFTNYILMSLIAMFLFYGNGFGLFGEVERSFQLLIVFAIWIVLLILSPFWLKHFRYGPLEWFWRVLTYWKIQPIKNKK
ncbi:MAG: DUF418 domain-containing protein [Bacteroidales bacterium]